MYIWKKFAGKLKLIEDIVCFIKKYLLTPIAPFSYPRHETTDYTMNCPLARHKRRTDKCEDLSGISIYRNARNVRNATDVTDVTQLTQRPLGTILK